MGLKRIITITVLGAVLVCLSVLGYDTLGAYGCALGCMGGVLTVLSGLVLLVEYRAELKAKI
tara:strand:- start:630 stop:815 length:186 start_codon:yes stop_codon:yes gene_type:complete